MAFGALATEAIALAEAVEVAAVAELEPETPRAELKASAAA